MQMLVIELEKMSREIGNQLDTKAARLEGLLQEADRRSAELRGLMGKPEQAIGMDVPVDQKPKAKSDSGLAALDKHQRIYSLADEGKSVTDIARALDRPAGEVELIIALRG